MRPVHPLDRYLQIMTQSSVLTRTTWYSHHPSRLRRLSRFTKKIFRGSDIVDVGPYAAFGLSGAQLMSVTFISNNFKQTRARNARKAGEIANLSAQNTSLRPQNNQQADWIAQLESSLTSTGRSSSRPQSSSSSISTQRLKERRNSI